MSNVKQEIKQEDNGDKVDEPELMSDPEDYLEKGESLDMDLTNGNQKIWLVKLPKYLATKWQNPNLMGKQLGRVKIRNTTANGHKKLEVKLVVDDSTANDEIPQEYDISILNTQVRNSYVFSEENLQRFKAENTELSSDRPIEKTPEVEEDYRQRRYNRFGNGQNQNQNPDAVPFVKTIPKKTALCGKICHDCQIRPSITDKRAKDYAARKHTIQKEKVRPKVVLLDEIPGVSQSNAGPSFKGRGTNVFLKPNTNKNKNEGRAIRMPQKDLLDLLFRLFEEYEYWSIKGLRERTKQPESYLKESLDSIANLIKKGPYTSKYNLKPEYKKLRDAERAAKAGLDINHNDNNDQEEEEEDDDMEDVL
ncbi:transcription initiation factor IIF subunit beta [Yamadazyma tenuis]|uniref:Transcription initiation factor IIF subunit beta n=1 Tax=Candida tenuis (strain ATCC 10573 / BCRC 21748 / CBS 615 / JCM 9827 / NBRC 10315 / NRRL Y-1498 / VKM Y-70) TaxID=590646 RepID=G3BF18_CANTC|nr:transcription initiation factor IIF, beta subunit [Yamadazyma tenuis ATCC 10573]XP_006690188.1 uncharacterized protein CANTEDRAFT_116016 [Yamadazyma tenuis ATCC 10573]EGV60973.1 transcription initiation factor IIF, beta subunit [Yamadazyma tenuis ATCC 10573]EGV60974.1 hypothetical protein CANTEDRAFT_116016 [Yamadazyma tenuis ATCC 10573]WEJ94784.1 transcription initiation factor IIF subunit beta [Yamadazyma tenuis]